MIQKLFEHSEMRRILIMVGAAGICTIFGAGIYVAAIKAVTPTGAVAPLDQRLPTDAERGF